MADVNMHPTWTLKLDTEELRLVLRALGDRIEDATERAEAEEIRAKVSQTVIVQADRAIAAVTAKNTK